MPPQLQLLMRHDSIDTTMQFYVGRNSEATAEVIWSAVAKHAKTEQKGQQKKKPQP